MQLGDEESLPLGYIYVATCEGFFFLVCYIAGCRVIFVI